MKMDKASQTTQFIVEKVSPIFNKKGYTATSLSDITSATGLTKGAIYGNFLNKEELALAAFNYNVKRTVNKIADIWSKIESPLSKLYALTNFYREYYKNSNSLGGCPILNVGVDANNTNPELLERVKNVVLKLKNNISMVIEEGIIKREIKEGVNTKKYGGRIFSIIEGAAFTSVLLQDPSYLLDMMDHLDNMITNELKINN